MGINCFIAILALFLKIWTAIYNYDEKGCMTY